MQACRLHSPEMKIAPFSNLSSSTFFIEDPGSLLVFSFVRRKTLDHRLLPSGMTKMAIFMPVTEEDDGL